MFPAASIAKPVTSVVPSKVTGSASGRFVPGASPVTVYHRSEISEPPVSVSTLTVTLPVANSVGGLFSTVTTGATLSIDTVVVAVLTLPAASVATKVIVVPPWAVIEVVNSPRRAGSSNVTVPI